jgi:hypothetical protein
MLLRRKIEITEMLLTYRNRVYVRKIVKIHIEIEFTYENRLRKCFLHTEIEFTFPFSLIYININIQK